MESPFRFRQPDDRLVLGDVRRQPVPGTPSQASIQMRAAALIPLVMVVFAITSAAVSLGDAISRYINRAPYVLGVPNVGREPLRGMVPKGERLGFLSDRSDPGVTGRRMYAAIYTLAPFMVDNTPYRRFVVGDFQNVSASQPRLSRYGLRLVADLGNGFWLLAAAE